jgi:uncharacterized protein (TIGR02118 family)
MVRFLVLYPQPLDEAAFTRHYTEVHVPLAKALPGLRRYTVGRDVRPVRGEPVYLVAELEWDDIDSLQAAFQTELGRATAHDVTEYLEPLCPGIRSMILELEDV